MQAEGAHLSQSYARGISGDDRAAWHGHKSHCARVQAPKADRCARSCPAARSVPCRHASNYCKQGSSEMNRITAEQRAQSENFCTPSGNHAMLVAQGNGSKYDAVALRITSGMTPPCSPGLSILLQVHELCKSRSKALPESASRLQMSSGPRDWIPVQARQGGSQQGTCSQ